jgi:glycerophosphoryl diester phosphodiesterase
MRLMLALGALILVPMAGRPSGAGLRTRLSPPPTFISHRGYSRRYPENTVGSIREAVAHGAQWIEIDVRWTRDGEPVLHHDPISEGMTGLSTLREAVESMADNRANLYLHLKGGELGAEEARKLISICRSNDFLRRVRFNSGSFTTLRRLRDADANVWLEYDLYDAKGLLWSNRPTGPDLRAIKDLAIRSVGTFSFKIDASFVAEAHHHGLLVNALVSARDIPFHVERAAYLEMLALNVDEIMTDEIGRYLHTNSRPRLSSSF